MCCFSGTVQSVTGTRIFARHTARGRQGLAYAMKLSAPAEVAMVLPLPVPKRTPEDDVRFLDLSAYPNLFDDLQKGYPVSGAAPAFGVSGAMPLQVHRVGAFDASFVPTIPDFERLEARFRLASGVWDALPTYRDWGFAVFKLRAGANQDVHPMAFDFPTRAPEKLFFPTVHVHDGDVHREAEFAHSLYCQNEGPEPQGFWRTPAPAAKFVDTSRTLGLVDPNLPVGLRSIWGRQKNEDVWVDV